MRPPTGWALIAYAGLGATARGTQPSEWVSAVLRGRSGLNLEHALFILSTAANKELPRHLAQLSGGAHFIIIPAFVRGVGSRIYTIDNVLDRKAGRHFYRYTSHQRTAEAGSPSVRMAVGGTGGYFLAQKRRDWQRALFSLVKAHDRGRVSDYLIADYLARLNHLAHLGVGDGSVGPRCIVTWRRRPDARRPASGGAHQFYTGIHREPNSDAIPTILNGMDVRAVVGALSTQFQGLTPDLASSGTSPFNLDPDELNRLLSELPSDPDDKLR